MTKRYFDLLDDLHVPGRWDLGKIIDERGQAVWSWLLTRGEPASFDGRLRVNVRSPGHSIDFSLAALDVPCVTARVAALLTALAPGDVQLIPVDMESRSEPYFLVNVTRVVKCIDDQASREVQHWTAEDGEPERVGEYRAVHGMRIDPAQVGDAKVFRPWGWTVALIVSEDIKEAFEREGVTGVKFQEVTGPSDISPEERERRRKLMKRYEQTDAAREAFWSTLGQLDKDALIPIVVWGGWPAHRQAWRLIHRLGGSTLLVTDGMSDFDVDSEEPSVGFGLELALETDELQGPVQHSWQQRLLERVGEEVAEHERVIKWLRTGMMSMEVSGKDMPSELVTEQGRVGVLLGMEVSTLPRSFDMPAGVVRLVPIQVLLPEELEFLLNEGKGGAEEMARRFKASGLEHRVRARRPPVV
ncbi:MAG TPA: DUF1629 domain-containing protein [Myxococcaceae bacterium]|jgi:hypothetical protein